jgi:hypothetical protein
MRRKRFGRWSLPLLLAVIFAAGVYAAGAQEIDSSAKGVGPKLEPSTRLDRMLLLLQPGASQRKALDTLLTAQQTSGNAEFHHWVTSAEFADRFALSAGDAAKIVTWLKSQGFAVAALPGSRGWVEFSGTVGQVQRAFGTGVVAARTGTGEARYRLSGEMKLPAAIASLVKGLVSLDGVVSAPAATAPVELKVSAEALAAEASPDSTSGSLSTAEALTPTLVAGWLQLSSSAGSATGSDESIAIPVRSNVRVEDFAAFRKSFGLPELALQVQLAGTDPGRTEEEAAAIEVASWAGAVAPGAQIVLVPVGSTNATDGLDLALAAAIDGGLARTVSVGYTACESGMSAAHGEFYAALYRQAAAEGIAVIAATGDSGAAACHAAGDGSLVSSGLDVNGLASTPWNTAVGAIAFTADAGGLTGWQPATATDAAYATGGGASRLYVAPEWQSAVGMAVSDPAPTPSSSVTSSSGHHRFLPDVSLPAAVQGSRGLAFCFSGDAAVNGCRLVSGGGSAASAAIFSGIAALLAQKYGPQGNLAPNLYALRRTEQGAQGDPASKTAKTALAFVDVTEGGARLRCVAGSPDCAASGEIAGQIGFGAGVGYDLASGLGSVNAGVLVRDWASPQATGTSPATAEMTTIGGVTYNPSATIVLSAKVISGSGGSVPTGTIQFFDETTNGNAGSPVTMAADGTASYSEMGQFTNGGHNIAAKYSGDSTYAATESQTVTIDIQPSSTSLVVAPSTTTPGGGSSITVTGTVTSTNLGSSPPTGTFTVNLDGIAQGHAPLATTAGVTSASVSVTTPTGGSHAIQGTYSGDTNYNNSTSNSVTITVAKVASATSIAATPSTLTAGVPETFTATVGPATAVTGTVYVLTGTVSFYDGGTTLLGTAAVSANTAILTGISLSLTAAHTVTAVYSGDTTYNASMSSPLLLTGTLLPVTVALTESNPVLAPDQPVTLTATVTPVTTPALTAEQHPSGYVLFYAGSALISGQVPVLEGLGNAGVASTVVPRITAGQYVITAQYSGDTTYGPAASNSLNLQAEDFTISCNVTNIDMVQGTTQNVTCNVASLGGLTGPIEVACVEQNPPQVGPIGCTFSPNIVEGTGQTTLKVVTTGGDVAQGRETSPWRVAGGGIALAFAVLLLPIGRRARRLRGGKLLGLALLLAGLASAGLGCSNSVTATNPKGTPLGVHTLKITAASFVNTVTVSHTAYLTVNVTP